MDHFLSPVVNIEDEDDERVHGRDLRQMSENVLLRKLVKRKEKGGKKSRNPRKKRTAHWRAESLTQEMTKYAVDDAACAVDVWMTMNGFREEGEH